MVGPFHDPSRQAFKSVRVAGQTRQQGIVQALIHAKLLLLGAIIESEGEMGEYVSYFEPRRLWLGSANLTYNSRNSLEFGLWINDASLVDYGNRFLIDLLKYSELLSSYQPSPEPERIPYEFDDVAMYEYLREHESEWGNKKDNTL